MALTDEMKAELDEYLKDHLSIHIDVNVGWMEYRDNPSVKVTASILLDGEVISKSNDYDTLPNTD